MTCHAQGHVEAHNPDRRMITIRLDDCLFEEIKEHAIARQLSMNGAIVEILENVFAAEIE